MNEYVLAADVGGTNIRAALVDSSGELSQHKRIQADFSRADISEKDIILELTQFFASFLNKDHKIMAIGIGFPGFFIQNTGVLASSPNLPNISNFSIAQALSDSLGIPVYAQNDALCAALGEFKFGAGQGSSNLLHITLGTGIGAGLILNNTAYTGEDGMAMEFGHLCVDYNDSARLCGCGAQGCVEAYASATAISAQYFELTGDKQDTESIFKHAQQGNQDAQNTLKSAAYYLGCAISESIKLLDIRTVSISGGPTGAWDILHPAMLQSLNTHLIPPLKGKISVFRSTLDDQAGILGAAALAISLQK